MGSARQELPLLAGVLVVAGAAFVAIPLTGRRTGFSRSISYASFYLSWMRRTSAPEAPWCAGGGGWPGKAEEGAMTESS